MARKTSTVPSRIMSFGCLPPDVGGPELAEELRRAHKYQNLLIEIERDRRAERRKIRAKYCPELAAVEAAIDERNQQIDKLFEIYKQRHFWTRKLAALKKDIASGNPPPRAEERVRDIEQKIQAALEANDLVQPLIVERKALSEQAKALRSGFEDTLQPTRDEFKARTGKSKAPRTIEKLKIKARKEMFGDPIWPEAWKEIAKNEARAEERVSEALKKSGIGTGTYGKINQAMEATRRDAIIDPKFKRYDGGGKIAVQLTRLTEKKKKRDVTVADLFNGRVASKISLLPGPKHSKRAYYRVRIALKKGFAELPVWLHRDMPMEAVVKWAWILVRPQGPRLVYQLQVSIETARALRPHKIGSGLCALNLGWRETQAGIRVGYIVGSDGYERSIECDPKSIELFDLCERLRSYSDQHFDSVRDTFSEWRDQHALPDWVAERCQHIDHWRAHGKLARVARRWGLETFGPAKLEELWKQWRRTRKREGLDEFASLKEVSDWLDEGEDKAMVLWLDWWRRKDEHLWTWTANEQTRAIRRRRQNYRLEAIALSERYETLVLDDTDLRPLAEVKKQGGETTQKARRQRHRVSPFELKMQLLEVFGKERVQIVSRKRNTIEHVVCGKAMDARPELLYLRCDHCGQVVDRDANNCKNQLARATGTSPKRRAKKEA